MQYRRDISQFTYTFQTCSADIFCRLIHKTCFSCSLCGTSGSNNDNIVSNQFLHQFDMCIVRTNLRIVTSNHSYSTADNTGSYAFQQWFRCSCHINLCIGNAIQNFHDCFYRITNSRFLFEIRNMYQFRLSVLEVFNRHLNDCFCIFSCCLSTEADKFRIRHLSDRRSCDKFGVETFAQRSQRRENTLNVYYDCFTCSGQYYVFLLQEVTCHRNTAAHSYFVGCTANTGYGDSFCSHFFCICDHFRIISIFADHLGKARIMTMNNDIYVVNIHNTKVCFCIDWLRSSEQYVRELCSHHGTAPSISKTTAQGLFYQCFRFGRTSHMSHMHGRSYFTVDCTRCDFIINQFLFL